MLTLLKTYSVMIPVVNYGMLGLLDIGLLALLPLFYSSPIEIGGLGFPPAVIGTALATFGIVNGIVQASFGAKLIDWFGPKRMFCLAVLFFYPLTFLFPIMSAVVTVQGKVGPITWVLIFMQLSSMVFTDLAFRTLTRSLRGSISLVCVAAIFVFITRAAPNKQSLGSVNGLSQSFTSIARALGPASMTSLFAVSKQYNVLGGNLVYAIVAILVTTLVMLSRRLSDLKDET